MGDIWYCKIGAADPLELDGADLPMRQAVAWAYEHVTGVKPSFLFSGWGAELTEGERKALDREEGQ